MCLLSAYKYPPNIHCLLFILKNRKYLLPSPLQDMFADPCSKATALFTCAVIEADSNQLPGYCVLRLNVLGRTVLKAALYSGKIITFGHTSKGS